MSGERKEFLICFDNRKQIIVTTDATINTSINEKSNTFCMDFWSLFELYSAIYFIVGVASQTPAKISTNPKKELNKPTIPKPSGPMVIAKYLFLTIETITNDSSVNPISDVVFNNCFKSRMFF